MKKKLSELVFILDKSGSMAGKEDDTIGSFNSTLKKQKNKDYDVLVTTVLFSDEYRIIHDRIDINKVKDLTKKDYETNGGTALIDAIGKTIKHIKDIQKYQRRSDDIPEHTLFVIVTDGEENSSYKYSSQDVKRMIKKQKEKGWEFLFIGANIDSVETAKCFSIEPGRAINYNNDSKGLKKVYDFVGSYASAAFECDKMCSVSDKDLMLLREDVDDDYNNRKV